MTVARRLTKLEDDLDPESAVNHWLAEAQRFPTLEAYTDSWTRESTPEHPLHRIAQQVEAAARQRLRTEKRSGERAVDRAVHAAVLRVQLVVQIDLDATDSLRVDGMLAVAQHHRLRELAFREVLAVTDAAEAQAETLQEESAAWADQARDLHDRLGVKRAARETLETRYLGSRASLFPETAGLFERLAEMVEGHVAIAKRGDHDRTDLTDESAVDARADRLLALASRVADAYMGWL